MKKSPNRRNLPMLLLRAREAVMSYFREDLKRYGITEQQWRVIRTLDALGELEVGQIAKEAFILAPSLTGVLERMEKAGLIVRHRLSIDQRKIYVDLTPLSRELAAVLSAAIEAHYRQMENAVGNETLDVLYGILEGLIALPGPVEQNNKVVRERLLPGER